MLLVSGGDEIESFAMIIAMENKFSVMNLFDEGFPLL